MRVVIEATETIVYSRMYELEELEEHAEITLEDVELAVRSENTFPDAQPEVIRREALDRFVYILQQNAGADFQSRLERHGDVQGQVWAIKELSDGGDGR